MRFLLVVLLGLGLSGSAMSIVYEAKVRQARWVAGARVVVDLHLRNSGSTAFETPDPQYRTSPSPQFELIGPDGKKQAFRPSARATERDQGKAPTMLKLAPGQEWEGDLVLGQFADLSVSGHYVLHSWIDAPGGRIESKPSEFDIGSAGTRDLTAEMSVGEDNSRVVECVELMDGGHVVSSMLDERDPSNAELHPFNRLDRGRRIRIRRWCSLPTRTTQWACRRCGSS